MKTLQKNAKLTTKELADAVHLTPAPCERQTIGEEKAYQEMCSVLDPEKLNQDLLVFCKSMGTTTLKVMLRPML